MNGSFLKFRTNKGNVVENFLKEVPLSESLYDEKRRYVKPVENKPFVNYVNMLLIIAFQFNLFYPLLLLLPIKLIKLLVPNLKYLTSNKCAV